MQRLKNLCLLPQVLHVPPVRIKSTSISASGHVEWTFRSLGNVWGAWACVSQQLWSGEKLCSLDIWVLCFLGGLCFFSGLFLAECVVVFGFWVFLPFSEFIIFWAFGLLLPNGSFHKTIAEKSSTTLVIPWESSEAAKVAPFSGKPGWRFANSPVSTLW